MPSRRHPLDDPSEWTMHLPQGPDCSVGYSANEAMNWDGTTSSGRQNEDRYYTCIHQDSIQLYMVLDGHDGSRAVKFAQTHIPHFLLHSELVGGGDKLVMDALRKAIVNTEREFFIRVDPYITRKVTLQYEIEQKAPDADSGMALRLFPSQISEIGRLDDLIKGGTTVVAALLYDSKLYVANVGDSRALLCSQSREGSLLSVQQLSVDHNTSNEDELRRLEGCGLDPNALRRAKRLGMQQNTRSIGDHSIKGGYNNVDIISHATCEPGTAEPYLHEPINLAPFHGFLILMSDGLYEAYEAWTGRPDKINEDIAHLVAQELKSCAGDFKVVAQKVVDKVKVLYRDTCKRDRRSGRLDDITLIVKSLGVMLMRSQSTRLPYHQHYQAAGEPLPTAPITDQHFEFRVGPYEYPPNQYPPQPQPGWERPRYPPDQQYSPRVAAAPPRPQYYRQDANRYRGDVGQPWRGEPPSLGGGASYRQYPPDNVGYQEQPQPQPSGYYPNPPPHLNHPPPSLHQPLHPSHPTQPPPPPSEGRLQQSPARPNNYSPNDSATEHFTPPATDHRPQQATPSEETPPPVPPRTHKLSSSSSSVASMEGTDKALMSSISERDREMYGWDPLPNPDQGVSQGPQTFTTGVSQGAQTLREGPQRSDYTTGVSQGPQTLREGPQRSDYVTGVSQGPHTLREGPQRSDYTTGVSPIKEEPVTLKEEPQTLQEAPITFTAPGPQPAKEGPMTLQPQPQEIPQGAKDSEARPDSPGSGNDDYFYIDDEGLSSQDEDEVPDGDGAINPYIRFNEHFPMELSWNDIAVDPLSS